MIIKYGLFQCIDIMESYLNHGKLIIPVKLSYDVKEQKKKIKFPRSGYKNIKTVDESNDLFKMNPDYTGVALLTGKINNITVIDVDNIDEFNKIKNEIGFDDLDSGKHVVVNTHKGFHIYCAYNPDVKQTVNISNCIDIRNDGGCVFCPPSYYYINSEDKKKNEKITYDFNEGDIIENLEKMNNLPSIPNKFMNKLMNSDIKTDMTKTVKNSSKKNTKNAMSECGRDGASKDNVIEDIGPNIRQIRIGIPIQDKLRNVVMYLEKLPDTTFTDYDKWRNVGFALAHYSNKDEDMLKIYDEYSQKSSKYDKSKVNEIWKYADLEREDCLTIRYIKKLIRENKTNNMITNYIDKDIIFELIQNKDKDVFEYINLFCGVITSNDSGKMIYCEKEFTNGKLRNIILIYTDKNLIDKIPGEIKLGENGIPIMRCWINSIQRKEYRKIIFEPGIKDETNLNLFLGFNYDKIDDFIVKEDNLKFILFHIKEVICSGDENSYVYLINWLAFILQFPNKRMGIAIVCKSQQGVGKNIFFETFYGDMIIGRKHSICVSDPSQVVGKFNGSIENMVFTVVNEIKAESDMLKMSNLLKSLITDTTQKIEKKGQDALTVNNYNNYVFLTNNHHVVNVETDDRRYFCLSASSKYKRQQSYFDELVKNMLTDDIANEFFQYLMNIDLSKWNYRNIPMTKYKSELMKYSINPIIKWFNDYIKNQADVDISIRKNDMYALYKETAENNNFGKIKFFDYLKDDEKGINSIIEIKKGRSVYLEFNKNEVIEELTKKSLWVEE